MLLRRWRSKEFSVNGLGRLRSVKNPEIVKRPNGQPCSKWCVEKKSYQSTEFFSVARRVFRCKKILRLQRSVLTDHDLINLQGRADPAFDKAVDWA
jgi:hypothetical protein